MDLREDSIKRVIKNRGDLRNAGRYKQLKDLQAKLIELEKNPPITRIKFDWLTVIGALGKKSYYTFDPTQDFSQQIQKEELGTFTVGLVWNYYRHSLLRKKAFYANAGFLRMRDNNTSFLSTVAIAQERETSRGDTTRTISRVYNAYTDPVNEYQQWSLFANFFYMFTGRTSGFHIYPSVDIRDHDNSTLTHLGIGYAISFINEKKDQPVINVEGYVKFIDLFNKLDINQKFWNRNEIGIRFTLPLNFLTDKININEKESK